MDLTKIEHFFKFIVKIAKMLSDNNTFHLATKHFKNDWISLF